jgi:hypothetical protein
LAGKKKIWEILNISIINCDDEQYVTIQDFARITGKSVPCLHWQREAKGIRRALRYKDFSGHIWIPLKELTEFKFYARKQKRYTTYNVYGEATEHKVQ